MGTPGEGGVFWDKGDWEGGGMRAEGGVFWDKGDWGDWGDWEDGGMRAEGGGTVWRLFGRVAGGSEAEKAKDSGALLVGGI